MVADLSPRSGASRKFWVLAILLLLLIVTGSTLFAVQAVAGALQGATRVGPRGFGGPEDTLDQVSRCCRFTIVEWEVQQLTRLVLSLLLLPPSDEIREQDLASVQRFFALSRDVSDAELSLNRAEPGKPRSGMLESYQRLKHERDQLKPQVEKTLTLLIAQGLDAAGLAPRLALREDLVWPPVAFTIQRPPSVLVVSPREKIELERTTVLEPGLMDQQVLELEAGAEALGWSSIVEPTAGYSTYPTIITDSASLKFSLQAVAHEWTHTYLFFRPLGSNYFKSREMRTINETASNIVGREVSKQIMYGHFDSHAPVARSKRDPGFDFRSEMHDTLLAAERLLALGEVEEAEIYMEERRKLFVQHGYNIRKLNQAYFAFHGTYADSPASASPIGPQLERLFHKTGSISQFLKTLERVGSFEDYQRLLETQGVPEVNP